MFNALNHNQQQEVQAIMGYIAKHGLDDFIPRLDGLLPHAATPPVIQYTNNVYGYLALCKNYIKRSEQPDSNED